MSNRYEIKRLNDILNIPEDKFPNFLVDLKNWYELQTALQMNKELLGGVATYEAGDGMTWIDDDEYDATINLQIKVKK